jgi:hypothetical protein
MTKRRRANGRVEPVIGYKRSDESHWNWSSHDAMKALGIIVLGVVLLSFLIVFVVGSISKVWPGSRDSFRCCGTHRNCIWIDEASLISLLGNRHNGSHFIETYSWTIGIGTSTS